MRFNSITDSNMIISFDAVKCVVLLLEVNDWLRGLCGGEKDAGLSYDAMCLMFSWVANSLKVTQGCLNVG